MLMCFLSFIYKNVNIYEENTFLRKRGVIEIDNIKQIEK